MMVGDAGELSPKLQKFLDDFKEDLKKSRNISWTELREINRKANSKLQPGEDVHIVKDMLCFQGDLRVPIRIYQPKGYHLPIIVYFHGGGWVLGDLNSHDALCRKLANRSNCVVISVDYSLAPEKPYPAALNDGNAVLKWIMANSMKMEWDHTRVILAGDSAGGNLATILANQVKHGDIGIDIIHQILIYPITDVVTMDTPSYKKFGEGYYLEKSMMDRFVEAYIDGSVEGSRLKASPMHIPFIKDSPPATIITAGFDPLRDDGWKYAEKLRLTYVDVNYINYPNMLHGFLEFGEFDPEAKRITDEVVDLFKKVISS